MNPVITLLTPEEKSVFDLNMKNLLPLKWVNYSGGFSSTMSFNYSRLKQGCIGPLLKGMYIMVNE